MAKLQSIINLLQDTTLGLTFTRENWLSFLSTASMNYKYPFQDQVLIYAQRPQATACASIDFWNKSYKRWVKKNSKGIALIDDSKEDLKLKYVFDVADTHYYHDDRFNLWQLKDEHEAEVVESLINSFGEITKGDFVSNISQTAENLTVDNEVDYLLALVEIKEDSALENIEDITIQDELHETIKTSVEFMLLNRAGRVSEEYKNKLQFPYLEHFNTLDTISTLGTAVSEIAQMGIRDMERTVKAVEREKRKTKQFFAKKEEIRDNSLRENHKENIERRDSDGSDLSKERGLSVAGADHRAEPREDRQVWLNEEGIFKEGEASPIQSALDKGRTDESSVSGTSSSRGGAGGVDRDIQPKGEPERGNEEQQSVRMDKQDEPNQKTGGGDSAERNSADLSLSDGEQNSSSLFNAAEELPVLTSVQEQLSLFTAEDLSNPVTNGITTPAILKLNFSQNVKDEVLTAGSQSKDSLYRICAYFRSGRSKAENIRFLKNEFKEDYRGFQIKGEKITAHYAVDGIRLARGKSVNYASDTMLIPWAEAEARIRELIVLGKFMPEEELAKVSSWEINDTAVKVLNIYRDEFANIPDEEKFFVPTGTYPDSLEQIKELLKDKAGAKSFYDNIAHLWELIDKYPPRYRIFHDIPEAREQLDNLQRRGITLAADKNFAFYKHECFISDDEIDKLLIGRGSGMAGGKYRIYEYFNEHLAEKERIDFLKKEYGIGGSADGYNREDHDGKGISYARGGSNAPYDKVLLSWANVAKAIDRLIRDRRYLTEDELAQLQGKNVQPQQIEEAFEVKETKQYNPQEMPDLTVNVKEMQNYGYSWENMLPLRREAAEKLFQEDLPVFRIYKDGSEGYVTDIEDLEKHAAEGGLFGIEKADWDAYREYRAMEQEIQESEALEEARMLYGRKQSLDERPESLTFTVGFSEHPAFYDRQFNERYTNLSFALGNKLFGILDAKQHRERENEPNNVGWYHKTDFTIKAMIDGEEFNYEGRFDIGDGEGDLIAHVKNFYDYSLDPHCPFIAYWKSEGEEYYQKQMASLRWGREVFVPFLESHSQLTLEDEKLLSEIMSFENEWFVPPENIEDKEIAGEEKQDPEEMPLVTADTAEAEEKEINIPIGAEVTIDERKFLVESVNYDFNSVSLRDITFESNIGYPIFRNEKTEIVYYYLKQQEQTVDKAEVIPKINYRITADELNIGTPKEKFRRNIEAIRLLKKLEQENRLANADEQETLARYAGWGGLSEAFDENKANWHSEYLELKDLLSEEEYKAARESTLTAFYTPPIVIKAMYQGLANLGFTEGNILEPSCGVGNFLGLLPEEMQKSRLYGVELDNISGSIAQMLYQKEQIQIKGFEKTDFSDNFFDVALGNIPFGQFKVLDKRYDKENFLIHDFFFAKALDKVRPGGVVAFITSKGALDKENTKVRKYLAQRADLLGAIRLPNNTFSRNAGTEVTSDIIFLQKRERFITEPEVNWLSLGEKDGIRVNQYFIDNPNMVLGELKEISGPFGKETACVARDGDNLEELLAKAIKNIQGEIPAFEYEEELEAEEEFILADESIRNFSYGIFEGKLYYRQNSRMYPINLSLTGENRVRRMIEIRDCLRNLIDYQLNDYSDEVIEKEQAKLNNLYDSFTQEYGIINSRANALAFRDDDSYYLLCSLEILDNEGNFKAKADMFTKRTIRAKKAKEKAETSAEALAISIAEKAKVDMSFMEKLTDKSEEEIYNDLEGVIFLNPLYDEHNQASEKYLPADEYLSGNVREKLRIAKIKAETDSRFAINVTSLAQVQPTDLTAGEISVRLGANWLKEEYIEDFVYELLETPRYLRHYIKARYSAYTGEWRIEGKTRDSGNIKAINTYGTRRINGYEIIEDSLNLKDVRVMDYFLDEDGKRIATLNKKETAIALSKQELIKEKFSEWIFGEQKRREDICKTYNELFNSNRPREYDGSHITFSGMNPEISLRKHQINAAARILYGGNTLLAHTVGAGKTFTMTAAAMESKRLGLCQKSIFVVPNHLTEQWAGEFLQLYPSAKILVTTKKDFETKNRKKFCARIATGDYDAVIIGQSQFEKIPVSIERQQRIIERQIEDIIIGIAEAKNSRAENFTIKQMEKTKKNLEIKLAKLNDQSRKDDVITFEELGIDRMFVDESHFYKNRAKRCRIRVV